MSQFRDLIARRRPSGEVVEKPHNVSANLAGHENADCAGSEPASCVVGEGQNVDPMVVSSRPAPETVDPINDPMRRATPGIPAGEPVVLPRNEAAPAPSDRIVPRNVGSTKPRIWDIDPPASGAAGPDVMQPDRRRSGMRGDIAGHQTEPLVDGDDRTDAGRKSGRVKTRLLGFNAQPDHSSVFQETNSKPKEAAVLCPVGWVVVVDGPGRGVAFALTDGLSTVGRGEDQAIRLDFGDDSISRDTHAAIAYDDLDNKVLIGHGGKSNLVRLNNKPLVSTTDLESGDMIRIGKTTLRYVAFCGPEFAWGDADESAPAHG